MIIIDYAFGLAHEKIRGVWLKVGLRSGQAWRTPQTLQISENHSNLTGTNAELHMSLISWIGFGSCEVRRLTRALHNCDDHSCLKVFFCSSSISALIYPIFDILYIQFYSATTQTEKLEKGYFTQSESYFKQRIAISFLNIPIVLKNTNKSYYKIGKQKCELLRTSMVNFCTLFRCRETSFRARFFEWKFIIMKIRRQGQKLKYI